MSEQQPSGDQNSGSDPTLSPTWSPGTKRIVQGALLLLALLLLYRVRGVLLPIVISMIVAYALEPFVRLLERQTRIGRNAAIALVYTVLLAILIAIPVGTIPRIVNQVSLFIENLPNYLLAIGEFLSRPLVIREVEIPLNELQLEEIYRSLSSNLIGILRSIGTQSFTLFGNVASATLSTVQQVENAVLVPRIIGRQLNMHPMIVFIAALAGASAAGILGILLAAPVLATARLIIIYIYRKLNDLPPFPDMSIKTPAAREEA